MQSPRPQPAAACRAWSRGSSTRLGGGLVAALFIIAACASACARERVEVGDLDDASLDDDGRSPLLPSGDASVAVDARPGCGFVPTIGRCEPCPNGYAVENGETTCKCCE